VGLAQVEFVAGGAVVQSNRRHGLGAVTMKIARKHDTRCLGHNSSLQRPTSDGPLARNPNTNVDPYPLAAVDQRAAARMALAEEHGHPIDGELVEQSRVDALLDDVGPPRSRRRR
jgi:hypothetical protein